MSEQYEGRSPVALGRGAGALYLVIIVCGIFGEAFVRASLVVAGDAAATAANISASPGLFRVGFVADSLMLLSDVAIAVLFYVLLRPVDKILAMMAAVFRLIQAAVLGFNLLNYYAAMLLLSGAGYAASFETERLHGLVMLFLDLHAHGYDLGLLFFGVSSLMLGRLVVRSERFPSLLGYGLMAAAVVYLAGSGIRFLAPEYSSVFAPAYVVPVVAEFSFCLWLLAKGARGERAGPA